MKFHLLIIIIRSSFDHVKCGIVQVVRQSNGRTNFEFCHLFFYNCFAILLLNVTFTKRCGKQIVVSCEVWNCCAVFDLQLLPGDEPDLHSGEKSAPQLLIVSSDESYKAYAIADAITFPVSPDAMSGINGGMRQLLMH